MVDRDRMDRICLFCGKPPQNKNNEHPLPRWLLELTGDPARVVTHGYNWRTGEPIEFAFDSFKFPSCSTCNDQYSVMENEAKRVVIALCAKNAISPDDYVLLLDWLDKVRIGVWLGHRYLQRASWPPSFTINSRIAAKDRMVAVYTIGDHQRGLNVYGAESRLFYWKPSVFSLRINNTLLLNASWDWMCSGRCEFSYPKWIRHSIESQGALVLDQFTRRTRIVHPPMPGLIKSCVTLYQPILQKDINGLFSAMPAEMVEYCSKNQWLNRIGVGPIYRQFNARTERIDPSDPPIEFDSVSLKEAARAIDIAAQAYTLLNDSIARDTYTYDDGSRMNGKEELLISLARHNTKVANGLRKVSPERYGRLMKETVSRRLEKSRRMGKLPRR